MRDWQTIQKTHNPNLETGWNQENPRVCDVDCQYPKHRTNKLCEKPRNIPPPLYATHCSPAPAHTHLKPAHLAPWIFMIDRQRLALDGSIEYGVVHINWRAPWKNRISSTSMKLRKSLAKPVMRQNISIELFGSFTRDRHARCNECYSLNVHRYMRRHAWRSRVKEPNNTL